MKPGNKETPPKTSILSLVKPYKGMIFFLLGFAIISNGANLVIPKIISNAIDSYTSGQFLIKKVIVEFFIAALVIFLFTYLQNILQTYVSERVARNIRSEISAKISRQTYDYVIKTSPSRLLTNLTSDIDSIKMFVAQAIVSIASSILIIVGASVLLLTINLKLALLVLLIIPIIGGSFFIIFRKVRVLFKRGREIIDWLNKVINESILGSAIIRVLNSQQLEYNKFMTANTNAKNNSISILLLFATLIPIITFIANLAVLTILALGGHFVVTGTMTLGDFAAFNSYITILIFPVIMIGFMSNIIAQSTASYERIRQVLDAPDPVDNGYITELLNGDIDLKNVNVSYDDKPALKNVSFSIKAGQNTAILGPTAAGKTQLLYLLTGLIKPDSGIVEFDGRDIENYNKESFHSQIGFVFQDSIIFNISLRENIAFNDKVTDESLELAINTAELQDYIDSLPDKLDTIVSERGSSLSGGQKQRIMLARALAVRPKILLLDDFTARVDKKTEQKILCNLMNNYPGLTLVSVTQKIASIKHFDQIIVIMEGEIIATGKHKDLKETCPEYVQIYNSQRSTSHYEL